LVVIAYLPYFSLYWDLFCSISSVSYLNFVADRSWWFQVQC
jgi:hypothetical protein